MTTSVGWVLNQHLQQVGSRPNLQAITRINYEASLVCVKQGDAGVELETQAEACYSGELLRQL